MALLRSILHDLALVCLVAAGALACAVLWKALGTVDAVNATLKAVNAPCADNGHQVVCGPIAQLALAEKMIGNMAGQTQEQVRQSGLLITATTQNMDKVAASVTGEVAALQGTTQALTTTAQTASTSLQTITDGITPVLDSTKSTVDDVGAALGSVGTAAKGLLPLESDTDTAVRGLLPLEANGQTISNAFVTTIGTTNHMLFTFDAVETKAMHGYLYPPHGAAAIWPTVRPFLVPAAQVGGAVAISIH
jgi:hypothetical protein